MCIYIYIYIYSSTLLRLEFLSFQPTKENYIHFPSCHFLILFVSFLPNTNERIKIFTFFYILFISSTFSSSQSNITKLDERRYITFSWVTLELKFYAILKIVSAYYEIMNLHVRRPMQIEINDTVMGF